MQTFIAELKRRNVLRVAAFYAAAGWLLVQIATQVFPFFDIPNWVVRVVVVAIVLGFPGAVAFSWFYELTPDGLKLESEVVRSESIVRQTARRLDRWIIAVLGLAVAALLADKLVVHHNASESAGAGTSTAPADEKSIAVLPFENLSDDKSNAYFAAGIQDEILTRLAQVGALRVISRTSTEHIASSPDNLPDIARQLGVANILEGSVQKAGDAVHVNVQLIRAATDDHLWAQTYDRKLDNVFGVESEVAGAIAQALDDHLSGSERAALARIPTENAEAYDAYLRGIALQSDYDESRGYFLALIELFTKAVTADPNFAQAWAALSNARTQYYFEKEHNAQQLAGAKAAADAALRLQPDLPEAWLALGYYRYWGEQDYDGALEAYEHARSKVPNNPAVSELTGLVKRRQGHWDESLVDLRRAAQLDPHNSEIWINIGFSEEALHHYDPAREAYDSGLAAQPGNETIVASLAQSYLDQGNTEAAARTLGSIQLDPAQGRVARAYVQLRREQRAYAQGIAEWSKAIADGAALAPFDLAGAQRNRATLEICAGQHDAARADASLARERLEGLRAAGDTDPNIALALGPVYAALGDHAAALQNLQQGQAQIAKDAFFRPLGTIFLAEAQMLGGDHQAAIAALATSLRETGGITPQALQQDCIWDPLREEPGFKALLAAAGGPAVGP